MTDNEIIKALECCQITNCKECAYKGIPYCVTRLKMDAAEIIKSQQKNIAWLATPRPRGGVILPKGFLDEVRTKAIKEFADKLKEKISKPWYYLAQIVFVKEDIDELVKEMGYGNGKS